MAKPVILAVDDDPQVLRAVERDLRRKYAREYRVLRADSGESALDALDKLKLRGEPVALFLVDQRMPRMTGVEFLEKAIEIFPEAKRDLLTAYADTDAAIRAINEVGLDHYLQKPWDPPEELLYPILDDQLDDWQADFKPPFEGVRVVGDRWSPDSHRIRDFLARHRVPYRWLDVESSEEARQIFERLDHGTPKLPVVVFQDASYLEAPENREVAERIGLRTRAEQPFYDLLIIGGGPSGLAAAVYGASEGLKTVLVEREAPGGQAGTSSFIENYLGFPHGLKGSELARRAVDQARKFEVEILTPQEVAQVRVEDPYRIVQLADGAELSCHALIVATGVSYRKLDAPGVDRLTGAGVYYGASLTEAFSYKDEDVYIVGGADHLEWIVIKNSASGETESVPTQALFILIGAAPHTDWLEGVVERDERGFILAGPDLSKHGEHSKGWKLDRDPYLLETSVPGVFVAGDVRHGSIKRCASAVGEGSIAIQFVHQYLREV